LVAAVTGGQQAAGLEVRIDFHGPFRIQTGAAADGLDATFHPDNPLPASSIKGLMRAQAQLVLGVAVPIVEEVFGSPRAGSPWWWSDAEVEDARAMVRTSTRIDQDTGTVFPGAVRTAAELWPARGSFQIRRRGLVPDERVAQHLAVLAASARAVTALGSDRRRGLGWVSMTPDIPWDRRQRDLLIAARRVV
jgi:CRISPR/Cas system CSM-associated protein Csm3 (group 7 of RAMP superfamily)